MKRSMFVLMIFVVSVFSIAGLQAQAAEKTKYPSISYSRTPIKIEQVKKDFKSQWQEVLKHYPAAAIVFMYQEAALASLAYQQVETASEALDAYVSVSNTSVASAIEISIHLKDCINKLISCDMHAASDGAVTVDEVHGCGNAFSSCWRRNED